MDVDRASHPPQEHPLRSAWRWISAPLVPVQTVAGRRRRLLAWVLITLFTLTAVMVVLLLFGPLLSPALRSQYTPFILGLDVVLMIAYGLNAAGRYRAAAALTVVCATLAPWGSVVIDPAVLRGDFVPLAYATLSVMLCSILFSPPITAFLAVLQLAGYVVIALTDPAGASLNWPSLLALLVFVSVLSILSSAVTRDNVADLDRQRLKLLESEARLRELSVRDHLTQLFNRRYLEETLEREIRRSLRAHYTIGVILFDLDQFKQVNDTWGHAAGDLLLKHIGRLSLEHIRGGDIACRYGGDEFVLVLPEASRNATRQRAEVLRQAVRDVRLEYGGQPVGTITISVGIGMYPQHGAHGDELLRSADEALYRAKQAGRDAVVMAGRNGQPAASGARHGDG